MPEYGHQTPGSDGSAPPLAAIAFDMDGLLVDSEPLWFQAEAATMARLGGQWAASDQHALVGGSMTATVRYLLERATRPASPDQVARWLTDDVIGLIRSSPLPPLPGVLDLIAEVRAASLPHALVTSSEAPVVEAVLARLELEFPVVVCAADVAVAKPDPQGYRIAAARLGADAAQCIALEDSLNGVRAAQAAGYRVVAVPSVVPVPEQDGRVVIPSLAGVTLERLRTLTGLAGG